MSNMKNLPMFLFSYYQYSYAYELEQSLYVTRLADRTLCSIVHTIYMIRSRAKLRWRFIVPSGLPLSYACRSIGSKSHGDKGSFSIHGRGARVYRNLQM
jgi:hypothetical protein